MGRILYLTVFTLLLFSAITGARADVLIEDARINSTDDQNSTFTTAPIETGAGSAGDYEVVACAVSTPNGGAVFSTPTPNGWTQLDNGLCGGTGICSLSIWGRFTDTAASESIDCNWLPGGNVFAAGSFRYSNVDPVAPIIDVACDSGFGFAANVFATAPSVMAEAGSQYAVFWAYRNFETLFPIDFVDTSSLPSNAFFFTSSVLTFTNIILEGESDDILVDGPTGPASAGAGLDAEWRACALTLRMSTVQPRNVPTMSEWGLIAFAALSGMASFWYLRRRRLTA